MSRFAAVPTAALDDPRLEAMHLRVLTAVCSYSDKDGYCRVGQDKIAERARTNVSRVSQAIGQMVDMGWIRKRRTGKQKVNVYQVVMDRALDQGLPFPEDRFAETASHEVISRLSKSVTCQDGKSELPTEQITFADTANPIKNTVSNTVSNTARTRRARDPWTKQEFEEAVEAMWQAIAPEWRKRQPSRSERFPKAIKPHARKFGLEKLKKAWIFHCKTTDAAYVGTIEKWLRLGQYENCTPMTPAEARARAEAARPSPEALQAEIRNYVKFDCKFWDRDRFGPAPHSPDCTLSAKTRNWIADQLGPQHRYTSAIRQKQEPAA